MEESLAYYKGYENGLKEGIKSLRYLLESGRTLDDVLAEYNDLVVKTHEVFEKIADLEEQPESV